MKMVQIGIIVVFGIILMPVFIMIFASIFGKPRDLRVTGIFLGLLGGLILLGVVLIFLASIVLSFLSP